MPQPSLETWICAIMLAVTAVLCHTSAPQQVAPEPSPVAWPLAKPAAVAAGVLDEGLAPEGSCLALLQHVASAAAAAKVLPQGAAKRGVARQVSHPVPVAPSTATLASPSARFPPVGASSILDFHNPATHEVVPSLGGDGKPSGSPLGAGSVPPSGLPWAAVAALQEEADAQDARLRLLLGHRPKRHSGAKAPAGARVLLQTASGKVVTPVVDGASSTSPAPATTSAGPVPTATSPPAGLSGGEPQPDSQGSSGGWGAVDRVADALDQLERGRMPRGCMMFLVVLSVFLASVFVVHAINANILLWETWHQLFWLAFVTLDVGVSWNLAQIWGCQSLLIASYFILLPFIYFLGGLWQAFKEFDGVDYDGDGDIDWHDRLHAFRKTSQTCSLFYQTACSMLPLVTMGIGGFSFLWYIGALQPVLKELVVYGYCAMLLLACLMMFLFKIWRSLNTSIMQFFDQFKQFEHQAEDIIENIPDTVRRVIEQWRRGDVAEQSFEDRALANLHRDPFLTKPDPPGAHLADVGRDPFLTRGIPERRRVDVMLYQFAEALLDKFKNVEDAFLAFDTNKNGLLSRAEFRAAARQLPQFKGDAMAVFRALDPGAQKGRPVERLTIRDFLKLKEMHEQHADAKKRLEIATAALRTALNRHVIAQPTDVPEAEMAALRKAIDDARWKAVAQPVLREAEHALEEAEATSDLVMAAQREDPQEAVDDLQRAIERAPLKGVARQHTEAARQRLEDVRRRLGGPGGPASASASGV